MFFPCGLIFRLFWGVQEMALWLFVLLIGLFWLKEVGFSILDPHKVELLQRGN